jgi:hypothetical protein
MTKRFNDILCTSKAIDIEASYREMLRDCYADCLTGPFAYLDPADVLETMDPTAFRCGCNDWVDGQDWVEYGGDWYDIGYLEECRSEAESEIEDDIAELESEIEQLDSNESEDRHDSDYRETLENQIEVHRDELVMLYKLF